MSLWAAKQQGSSRVDFNAVPLVSPRVLVLHLEEQRDAAGALNGVFVPIWTSCGACARRGAAHMRARRARFDAEAAAREAARITPVTSDDEDD